MDRVRYISVDGPLVSGECRRMQEVTALILTIRRNTADDVAYCSNNLVAALQTDGTSCKLALPVLLQQAPTNRRGRSCFQDEVPGEILSSARTRRSEKGELAGNQEMIR